MDATVVVSGSARRQGSSRTMFPRATPVRAVTPSRDPTIIAFSVRWKIEKMLQFKRPKGTPGPGVSMRRGRSGLAIPGCGWRRVRMEAGASAAPLGAPPDQHGWPGDGAEALELGRQLARWRRRRQLLLAHPHPPPARASGAQDRGLAAGGAGATGARCDCSCDSDGARRVQQPPSYNLLIS